MAAGIGSRIKKVTNKPKSLLDVGNISILRHTVEMLLRQGIKVAVVVGYQKQEIFDELMGLEVTFFWNPFFKVTNSMASLWFAKDFLREGEDIILANADVYWDLSIFKILSSEQQLPVMLVDSSRLEDGDYFLKTKDNKIEKYGKDLQIEERSCEYIGVARINGDYIREFKHHLKILVEKNLYELWWENVLYEYCHEDAVYVKDVNGTFWAEVDTIEDYLRIVNHLKNNAI